MRCVCSIEGSGDAGTGKGLTGNWCRGQGPHRAVQGRFEGSSRTCGGAAAEGGPKRAAAFWVMNAAAIVAALDAGEAAAAAGL